jgi:hypothetical protein
MKLRVKNVDFYAHFFQMAKKFGIEMNYIFPMKKTTKNCKEEPKFFLVEKEKPEGAKFFVRLKKLRRVTANFSHEKNYTGKGQFFLSIEKNCTERRQILSLEKESHRERPNFSLD